MAIASSSANTPVIGYDTLENGEAAISIGRALSMINAAELNLSGSPAENKTNKNIWD